MLRAAVGMDREAVELLLAHGAIVDLPNVMGVTPFNGCGRHRLGRGGGSGPGQSPTLKARPNLESEAIEVLRMAAQGRALT